MCPKRQQHLYPKELPSVLLCEFVCLFVYLFPRRRLGFAQEISYAAASKAQAFADLVGAGGAGVFLFTHPAM